MAADMVRALSTLHGTFSHFPVKERVHILGRFLTCPLGPILEAIQLGATVLDIGAGHGSFARLAVARGARWVVAVEPDLRKALPAYRHPAVSFVAAFDTAIGGVFDVVTIIDVLYKLPLDEWDPLFARVFARLRPGGTFLLKELDPARRWKSAWNRVQERAASALNLTLGRSFSYERSEQIRARLECAGFEAFLARGIGRYYPHAHVLYAARRPLLPGGEVIPA